MDHAKALPIPPWALAVTAMLSVQLGSALSVHLISSVGAAGTAWLRLTVGALVFLLVTPPRLRDRPARELLAALALGVTTGVMTVAFLNAIAHIPLGTSVAIEFLGPVTVAALGSGSRRALVWPALALAGVVLLNQPWSGRLNTVGLGSAAVAAVGWGVYIVLTQRVGDTFDGIEGLSLTVPVAAVTTAAAGIPQASGHLSAGIILNAVGLALLLPILPYACEMLALKRMTPLAFGTLMAVEPAFGAMFGLLLLNQQLSPAKAAGLTLVVVAGAAAQQGSRRVRASDRSIDREPIEVG